MQSDWQTWAAAGLVALTLVIFLVRLARRKNSSACGKDCGCDKPRHP